MDFTGEKRLSTIEKKTRKPRASVPAVDTKLEELHFLCDLMASRDVAQVMEKVLGHVNRLGFSDFSYMRLDGKNSIDDKLNTVTKNLTDNYYKEKFWLNDMMTQYAAANVVPIFQTDINRYIDQSPFITEHIQRNLDLRRMVHGEGYVEYYNIPKPASNGSGNVLLSLTCRHMSEEHVRAAARRNGHLCEVLATAIDCVMTTKFPGFYTGEEDRSVRISPKPLLLLTRMARTGLSVKGAAAALNMSEDTVNKHIRAAKDALGAKTTAHAVYLAVKRGLIRCD